MWSAGLGALRQHCVGLGARWDYEVVSWLSLVTHLSLALSPLKGGERTCGLDSRLRGNDKWGWGLVEAIAGMTESNVFSSVVIEMLTSLRTRPSRGKR